MECSFECQRCHTWPHSNYASVIKTATSSWSSSLVVLSRAPPPPPAPQFRHGFRLDGLPLDRRCADGGWFLADAV